jgi:hypothetical protein
MTKLFTKDPDAVLDYKFDWSNWLESGEVIDSYVLTIPTGITKVSDSEDNTSVTVWLSGGTAGTQYQIACKITTDSTPVARVDERTMLIDAIGR